MSLVAHDEQPYQQSGDEQDGQPIETSVGVVFVVCWVGRERYTLNDDQSEKSKSTKKHEKGSHVNVSACSYSQFQARLIGFYLAEGLRCSWHLRLLGQIASDPNSEKSVWSFNKRQTILGKLHHNYNPSQSPRVSVSGELISTSPEDYKQRILFLNTLCDQVKRIIIPGIQGKETRKK